MWVCVGFGRGLLGWVWEGMGSARGEGTGRKMDLIKKVFLKKL